MALDIKRVLTLGGREAFKAASIRGRARKDGAQPGRRSGAPALIRALSLNGG